MRLIPSAFADGAMIPRRFTRYDQDLSPPLAWTDVPNNVRSFVLLCDDPDAPGGTWHHWCVYDIPRDRSMLPEGVAPSDRRFKQATNALVMVGRALRAATSLPLSLSTPGAICRKSVDRIRARNSPSCNEVENEAGRHVLTEAALVGICRR